MAAERMSLTEAEGMLPATEAWVREVLDRIRFLTPPARLDVLEIGSGTGRGLLALTRLGHSAVGVEPWADAINVARELARRHNASVDIRQGQCEQLPFPDRQFDVVLAFSVLEHVTDLEHSLKEIARVLKPGGVLWFNTTSALSPFQNEIRYFPLFGWYPDRMKKTIMNWCVDNWPAAINDTKTPALWWWTPRKAQVWLENADFDQFWDRWELRAR